jgi:hypothetical protein
MKAWGFYEFVRQQAEELEAKRAAAAPKPVGPTYARGSMEYAAQQEAILRGSSGDG